MINTHLAGIKIVAPTEKSLQAFSELPLLGDHHAPYDRLIVAQAISDRTPVVSSDHKFKNIHNRFLIVLVFCKITNLSRIGTQEVCFVNLLRPCEPTQNLMRRPSITSRWRSGTL